MSSENTTILNIELREIDSVKPYERNPRINDGVVEEPVEYHEDYLVYRDGRVYSKFVKRFLKPRKNTNGYLRYQIHNKDEYVHRIVAFCYLPNLLARHEINHLDGDKTNNHVDNLEWSTRSENNKHAFETGLRDYAELKAMANSTNHREAQRKRRIYCHEQLVVIRDMLRQGASDSAIVKLVGGHRSRIYQIRKGLAYKEN